MTEKQILAEAKIELEREGWTYWIPPYVRYYQRDIFGVFDLVAAKGDILQFIQLTTKGHLSHRREKIYAFFREKDLRINGAFVWAWNDSLKTFHKNKIW